MSAFMLIDLAVLLFVAAAVLALLCLRAIAILHIR